MSTGTGSSAMKSVLWLLAILVLGFMLFASIQYIRSMMAPAAYPANGLVDEPTPEDSNAPAAIDSVEEPDEEKVEEAVYTLDGYDTPQVYEGEQETTYRYSAEDSITVAPADNESLMLNSISATTEEEITVDGVEARRITGSSAKDGSVLEVIVVPLENEDQILFIRGEEEFLTSVEANLVLE